MSSTERSMANVLRRVRKPKTPANIMTADTMRRYSICIILNGLFSEKFPVYRLRAISKAPTMQASSNTLTASKGNR